MHDYLKVTQQNEMILRPLKPRTHEINGSATRLQIVLFCQSSRVLNYVTGPDCRCTRLEN